MHYTVRQRLTRLLWRALRLPPRLWYALGLGRLQGRIVLLLTTTGRVTGREHLVPLQYEEVDGLLYVGSASGKRADWFRNIQANPRVRVRIKDRHFAGLAEPVTDPVRVADFLALRLERHPRAIGAMLRRAGLPAEPNRDQLESYAAGRALVIIRPAAIGGDEHAVT